MFYLRKCFTTLPYGWYFPPLPPNTSSDACFLPAPDCSVSLRKISPTPHCEPFIADSIGFRSPYSDVRDVNMCVLTAQKLTLFNTALSQTVADLICLAQYHVGGFSSDSVLLIL